MRGRQTVIGEKTKEKRKKREREKERKERAVCASTSLSTLCVPPTATSMWAHRRPANVGRAPLGGSPLLNVVGRCRKRPRRWRTHLGGQSRHQLLQQTAHANQTRGTNVRPGCCLVESTDERQHAAHQLVTVKGRAERSPLRRRLRRLRDGRSDRTTPAARASSATRWRRYRRILSTLCASILVRGPAIHRSHGWRIDRRRHVRRGPGVAPRHL
mmetsp:Transcript_10411/g.32954  ORF Transcript_10411/g.32954 Transcript_10411/m.32954 type:complete len:214 (-) Transcript_10411:439-1080(-)